LPAPGFCLWPDFFLAALARLSPNSPETVALLPARHGINVDIQALRRIGSIT
jgi:hypothetical protein